MLTDLRFAFRQISKAPGFTAIIVLTLALSIGACTAIYSALDSIVLHPYDDPATGRNVDLRGVRLPQGIDSGISLPDFLDLEKQATSFEFMAQISVGGSETTLTRDGEPLQVLRGLISPRYLDILGAKIARGRAFLPEEFVSGKDNAILSYACWQHTFGGVSDIIGRTLQIDEKLCTVVGVVSERFQRVGLFPDVLMPLAPDLAPQPGARARAPRGSRGGALTTARLRRGVTIEQAQSELEVIAANLAEKYPETNKGFSILAMRRFTPSNDHIVEIVQILVGAVGCLMLIACANIASLLLVRANARQREISVRAALGASRGRLIRQLLTENILVALIGGAAGVLLAQWALDFIRSFIPTERANLIATGGTLGRLAYLEIDGGVLAFALGLSIATSLVFGLAPAWLSSSADLNEALKQGARGSTEGRLRSRFRATIVAVEIAIAVTLLACSGLFIRSFLKLAAYDPGFDPKHTAFVYLGLRGANYVLPEQKIAFSNALLTRIQSAPGVEAVGLTSFVPLLRGTRAVAGLEIEGGPATAVEERPRAYYFYVSPDYFRAMGIPLKQGRFFSDHDDAKAPRVAIINQTLARQFFPNQNPIGQRIRRGTQSDGWRVIVGVVGDVAQTEMGEVMPAQFYEPQALNGTFLGVVVRGHGNPALLPAIVQKEVHALDANLALGQRSTLEDFLRIKLTLPRLTLHLLTAFALVGLLIAAIGVYGVIAFAVSQRTLEIGIRMALGAQMQDVLRLVLRQGAAVVGIGFAIGTVATFIAGRAIESQLYNTSAHDPVSFVGVTVFFAAVAVLACWLPARRAMKVDPVVALRAE